MPAIFKDHPQLIFTFILGMMLALVIFLSVKYSFLRDESSQERKPYSLARMQLAWWTVIVLSSFIAIMCVRGEIPTFWESTLILLGISSATTAAARVIDVSDRAQTAEVRHQDLDASQNWLLDILSDEKGVSIHRFQNVMFHFVFGIWFIVVVYQNLDATVDASHVMPSIEEKNLVLLGLSSATYAGLKTTENKGQPPAPAEHVSDERNLGNSGAVG